MPVIDPLYVASGFSVGLLVGMTGVGGGSLMTPLLILLFGVHPATAVGTDLLYAADQGRRNAGTWCLSDHRLALRRPACRRQHSGNMCNATGSVSGKPKR